MGPRIKSITIKGFRAFGATEQVLNVPGDLVVVWGPNSKGKTSLAEAVEFLLTGDIARRELMASSQDEFADALRNAHVQAGEEVHVTAHIKGTDGVDHIVKRTLVSDYGKKQDCQSRLEIDGVKAGGDDLEKLGIVLLDAPLQAPVLAQHTLSYIFSVRPQDRATYFKTLLEVTDLDDFRNQVAGLEEELKTPDDPLLRKYERLTDIALFKIAAEDLAGSLSTASGFRQKLENIAGRLIEEAGEKIPQGLVECLETVKLILNDRRRKTFPVQGFEHQAFKGWHPPTVEMWTTLEHYNQERKQIGEETRRLAVLFEEALNLPVISNMTDPIDCALCGTKEALTATRVATIRRHVEETKGFTSAKNGARATLNKISSSAEGLIKAAEVAVPEYLKTRIVMRRKEGFTVTRIEELLEDGDAALIAPWLAEIRRMSRVWRVLRRKARAAKVWADEQNAALETAFDPTKLRELFNELETIHDNFTGALEAYKEPADFLRKAINHVLDVRSDTAGWEEFVNIGNMPETLREILIDRQAKATVREELNRAVKQIDDAKEKVLNDKFSEYSGRVQKWWGRLRPDEPAFFSAVKPRKGAKRTIDLKAGLSVHPDRSAAKVRDVISVFSESQLHCLGLALFLARAEYEGMGFIVLDDPVLSSDQDYRVHFNSTVITELLNIPMQIIILTQDHSTWKEIEVLYRHIGVANAQLFIETTAEGSVIENTSDALLSMLGRAKSLAHGGHPDVRKACGVQLRDAGERFCKEILIKDRKSKGEASACLGDYNGKTLEWLCPHVEPLLIKDAADQGKLEMFRNTVNPACHDDIPPGNEEMKMACGNLRRFAKDYLGR